MKLKDIKTYHSSYNEDCNKIEWGVQGELLKELNYQVFFSVENLVRMKTFSEVWDLVYTICQWGIIGEI
jgi:hypothetical protein